VSGDVVSGVAVHVRDEAAASLGIASAAGGACAPPAKLYVEPTNECNLACRTCVRHSWDEPGGFMEWELFERLAGQFAKLAPGGTLAFAGLGEPLLHPRFADMVARAKQLGLRAEVTSNAMLLTPELARRLIDDGLDQFVVSVDGTTAETFGDVRSGASLERVVANVRLLDDRSPTVAYTPAYPTSLQLMTSLVPRVRIGVEFVVMRSNVHQLPELQRLAARLAASFIIVSNVLPYTPELVDEALYERRVTSMTRAGTPQVPRWYLPLLEWNAETAGPLSDVLRQATQVSILGADLGAWANHCPFIEAGALAARWDGAVSPCPPLLHTYRCYVQRREKLFTHRSYGTLETSSLAAIWEDEEYLAFRDRVRDFDFSPCVDCGGCEMAEGNLEDCFGNEHPVCGDCLWARGVIRCA
jgi:MoaA/NifB/PqqE/SkfB family radical SAM enzyme